MSEQTAPTIPVKAGVDNRHLNRQLLVQLLYEHYFHRELSAGNEEQSTATIKFPERELQLPEDLEIGQLSGRTQRKLQKSIAQGEEIIAGVEAEQEWIDAEIVLAAPTWPLAQINPVDLAILRLALYEGFRAKTIPARVAIDEAIELTKDFGAESDVKFVSGVLGNIYNKYRDGLDAPAQ